MGYASHKPARVHGLCDSEDLIYKVALAQQVNENAFKSEKEILKKVMDARKSSSTTDFIHESSKFGRPTKNREERMKRTLLVAQAIQVADQIYGHREALESASTTSQSRGEGMVFGKNDWFMGPFYSYDKNSQAM